MKSKICAFTLAEVMIVLTVIGILTAILLPTAFNSTPDEDVMKFKKAHTTLYKVINELVTSKKYYKDGDLGIDYNGNLLSTTSESDKTYFCETFADVLNAKSVKCSHVDGDIKAGFRLLNGRNIGCSVQIDCSGDDCIASQLDKAKAVTNMDLVNAKEYFDYVCKYNANLLRTREAITTTDGIVYYQASPQPFGTSRLPQGSICQQYDFEIKTNGTSDCPCNAFGDDHTFASYRFFSPPNQFPANFSDENGNDIAYKVMCIDIDGIPSDVTNTNCKNECPFGYGIRADGKIMLGTRASEWIKKSSQNRD